MISAGRFRSRNDGPLERRLPRRSKPVSTRRVSLGLDTRGAALFNPRHPGRCEMLSRSVRTVLLGAVTLAACGANPADIEEIKKGQKDILSKLDSLDKAVQQVKAAPAARPQMDPNKVYNIPGNAYLRGPKTAKVTIAEFSDFQ